MSSFMNFTSCSSANKASMLQLTSIRKFTDSAFGNMTKEMNKKHEARGKKLHKFDKVFVFSSYDASWESML